jgi:hypothetical protein
MKALFQPGVENLCNPSAERTARDSRPGMKSNGKIHGGQKQCEPRSHGTQIALCKNPHPLFGQMTNTTSPLDMTSPNAAYSTAFTATHNSGNK